MDTFFTGGRADFFFIYFLVHVLYCIVLYLFKRILQKQMDAYHGSLPHKYRKKNGEMGRGEWKMKHGKKGNKYLNIEV